MRTFSASVRTHTAQRLRDLVSEMGPRPSSSSSSSTTNPSGIALGVVQHPFENTVSLRGLLHIREFVGVGQRYRGRYTGTEMNRLIHLSGAVRDNVPAANRCRKLVSIFAEFSTYDNVTAAVYRRGRQTRIIASPTTEAVTTSTETFAWCLLPVLTCPCIFKPCIDGARNVSDTSRAKRCWVGPGLK